MAIARERLQNLFTHCQLSDWLAHHRAGIDIFHMAGEVALVLPNETSHLAACKCWPAIPVLLMLVSGFTGQRNAFAQNGPMLQPTIEHNYQSRPYQGQLETDDGQCVRPAKDYASTRYSSLDQINAGNVKTLKLAFTFSTGMTHGHEAAPLVVKNTMYILTPFPNSLHALDLTKPGAPMKWVYQPLPTPASQGGAGCEPAPVLDSVSRTKQSNPR